MSLINSAIMEEATWVSEGMAIAIGNTKLSSTHQMVFLTTVLYTWHPHI